MSRACYAKISVSLPEKTLRVIDQFAEISDVPRSQVIAHFLEQALPTLEKLGHTLREFAEMDRKKREALIEEFSHVENRAKQLAQEAGESADALLSLVHATKFAP
jgi:metal-responsive CopG/Arc/MetJ family transcriptional regulator